MEAWSLCRTQLRKAGMDGRVYGLDYTACQIRLARCGLDHPEVWDGLAIVEDAFLEHLARKQGS